MLARSVVTLRAVKVEDVPQAEHVSVHLDPADVMTAFAGHRRRFASEMATLDADALASPSRCTEWSNADVMRHLFDVDGWMRALWSGQPPPFTSFDPNTTPHEFVVAGRSAPDGTVRDRYVESCEQMAKDVEASGPERFGEPSISPLGFVPWWLSVLHIFWDSWLHERDILLPLGRTPPEKPDELAPVFTYALTLAGRLTKDEIDVEVAGVRVVTSPTETGRAILEGGAVTVTPVVPEDAVAPLIDALAGRGDADEALARFDDATRDRLLGLARLFLGEP
jgi:uncharacterized protein (TIGR03083 family)